MSKRKHFVFALCTTIAFFTALEIGLRLAGIAKPVPIGALRFGYPPHGIPRFDTDGIEIEGVLYLQPICEEDESLFWRPIPSTRYTDEHGFRVPGPVSRTKPENGYRVALLGDSCTFLGRRLYGDLLAERLADELGQPVDVLNASCPGYSSYQGRRRLDSLWEWNPDLIVIYFGWNDHWKSANGFTDVEVAQRRARLGGLRGELQRFRTYRTLARLLAPITRGREGTEGATVRVPLSTYRENLEAMVEAAARKDRLVILVTAPSAFRAGEMPDWAFAFFEGCYAMKPPAVAAIPETHESYNEVVRQIARTHQSAALGDLAALWSSEETPALFRHDGIHLSDAGHARASEALLETWRTFGQQTRNR